jgi:polyphenol oxidase
MTNVTVFKSSALREIKHGFFGRNGGISEGVVASLNCYPYIREKTQQIDESSNVKRNRKIILETLELESEDVISANQVHGDNIAVIKGYVPIDFADADGIITTAPNLPIGVLTADCVPILYADIHHKIVGVAHAGWKGAFLDIHLKMVQKFKDIGVLSDKIKAVIGPSIQQASYEVDQAFYERFVSKGDQYQTYFYPSIKANHYQFDLPRVVYDDLMRANLHTVDWVRLDTVIHEDLFFSHRRATLNGNSITGRQLSVISL